NSYLYGGAPLAMPVRILVAEEQAQEADRILREAAGNQIEFTTETTQQAREQPHSLSPGNNNPWEILAVAALLLLLVSPCCCRNMSWCWLVHHTKAADTPAPFFSDYGASDWAIGHRCGVAAYDSIFLHSKSERA
ncbi:MAG: DUF2007 domain-containing protein, partial [Verrucomicrobiota bacterium]|nr:DUF2007 domain-containing protein [Verrucomicrobiota bacterium]